MTALDEYVLVFHTIKAKLYPNHLQSIEGNYISHTDNEKTLYPMDIVTSLTVRANFSVTVEDMMKYTELYHAEEMYQLADGYAVSMIGLIRGQGILVSGVRVTF
jgi:hypothetical protein